VLRSRSGRGSSSVERDSGGGSEADTGGVAAEWMNPYPDWSEFGFNTIEKLWLTTWGQTRSPFRELMGGPKRPRSSTWARGTPISSWVSRSAAASEEESVSSIRPPGKLRTMNEKRRGRIAEGHTPPHFPRMRAQTASAELEEYSGFTVHIAQGH
jgi:hypothetical protein